MENIVRPNLQRANQTILVFWILLGISSLLLVSNFMQYNLLTGGNIDDTAANANDMRQGILSILYLIGFIVSAVFFIMWFRRAYWNLHAIGAPGLGYTEGWAAGSWFVPILNLFRPYHIMKEIWNKTQEQIPSRPALESAELVGWWWAFWVIGNIISNISFRVSRSADTVDELTTSTLFSIAEEFFNIPALLLAIQMIKKTREFELQMAQGGGASSTDVLDHLIVSEP